MKRILLIASISATLVLTGCLTDDIPEPVSFSDQLAADVAEISQYLVDNDIAAEVHETGIRYVVNDPGDGDNPVLGGRIALKFTASTLGGRLLLADTIGFTINFEDPVVESWQIILPLAIDEGGSVTIYSPSGYAYGPNGNSSIPPNENIIFEIELLNNIISDDEQTETELAIIDEFLNESNIDFQVHSSGIRYVTLEEGTGNSPTAESFVSVRYEGKLLSGFIFDSSDVTVSLALAGLIDAWQIMLPEMKEGGSIRLYAPSIYCYSGRGATNILPYTPLVFEISLEGIN